MHCPKRGLSGRFPSRVANGEKAKYPQNVSKHHVCVFVWLPEGILCSCRGIFDVRTPPAHITSDFPVIRRTSRRIHNPETKDGEDCSPNHDGFEPTPSVSRSSLNSSNNNKNAWPYYFHIYLRCRFFSKPLNK